MRTIIVIIIMFISLLLIATTIISSIQPIGVRGSAFEADKTPPYITITNPPYSPYSPVIHTNETIVINGTAFDSGSRIKKVEAFSHTFPFNDQFPYKLATPTTPGNWSKWSFPLIINTTGTYRILIKATDNAGNENWAEKLINIPFILGTNEATSVEHSKPSIAIINPTFTNAAYREHGFYTFYYKYGYPPFGINIRSDLDMLTTPVLDLTANVTNKSLTNLTALIPSAPEERNFLDPLISHVVKATPNATITFMRDEDINDGHIFGPDGNNAYHALILLHEEYVTQREYDNFKRFVMNGGTIVFIDGNVFFAQVGYDKDKHTATLIKGHYWEFDGKTAKRGISERWYNETKDWVGGNFLDNSISTKITFANNPFNYTHFEEQFVNNPNDKILIDYLVKFPGNYDFPSGFNSNNTKIATYELNYGKGKVIMIGLYAQLLMRNEAFLKFFDNEILKRALH
jgi:hypothetical protein